MIDFTMVTETLTSTVIMVRPILAVKVPQLTPLHGLPLWGGKLPIASIFIFFLIEKLFDLMRGSRIRRALAAARKGSVGRRFGAE